MERRKYVCLRKNRKTKRNIGKVVRVKVRVKVIVRVKSNSKSKKNKKKFKLPTVL